MTLKTHRAARYSFVVGRCSCSPCAISARGTLQDTYGEMNPPSPAPAPSQSWRRHSRPTSPETHTPYCILRGRHQPRGQPEQLIQVAKLLQSGLRHADLTLKSIDALLGPTCRLINTTELNNLNGDISIDTDPTSESEGSDVGQERGGDSGALVVGVLC